MTVYSFSRLYTHKKLNYAHKSENLKLMCQLQDSRLLNSEHNSIVFMRIEMQNHIFAKFKSPHLAHLVHLETPGLQKASPIHQLVSLTSHLFKLNGRSTSLMCQSRRGLRWALCWGGAALLRLGGGMLTDFYLDLFQQILWENLKMLLYVLQNKYSKLFGLLPILICALISSLHPLKDSLTVVVFILLTVSAQLQYCEFCKNR